MSEVIVQMELPKLCFECFFRLDCELYMNELRKPFEKRDFTAFKPLSNGCLIHGVLPDDHGDLIDRDALMETCQKLFDQREKEQIFTGSKGPCVTWNDAIYHIKSAPTIDAVEVVRKPVKGYEGYYEVDNLARVYSVDRTVTVNDNGRVYDKPLVGKKLKQHMHSKGYKIVPLTKDGITKNCFVHRIVAEAFIDNPNELPMINHIDEDKTNNLPENLEWCTNYYNMMYGNARAKQARKIRGIPHTAEHNAKISESLKRYYKERKQDWFCADGERRDE